MVRFKSKCIVNNNNPIIPLEEKQSKISFLNPSRQNVQIITIDGCQITDGTRCDYLVIPESGVEHFVELKGSDFHHAIEQLETTIKIIHQSYVNIRSFSFVIITRSPRLSPRIQIIKNRFKKDYNSTLIIKKSNYEHKI